MSKPQSRPMQESENYFWYYADILGKGATGEVYKCLEKVGYYTKYLNVCMMM